MNKEREIKIVRQMIQIYCKKKHKSKKRILCQDCKALLDYVVLRRNKCPFKDDKPFCAHCKIHCYKLEMREEIRKVMRFSGPWMLLYNPPMAIRHMIDSKKEKRLRKESQRHENKK